MRERDGGIALVRAVAGVLVVVLHVAALAWKNARNLDVVFSNPLQILSGPVEYHLWFLFELIGMYFFLPVLRLIYRAPRQTSRYYLALCLLASGLSTLHNLTGRSWLGISWGYFPIYSGYALLGAWLISSSDIMKIGRRIWAGAAFVVASIGTAAGTTYLSSQSGNPTETLYGYNSVLVVVASAAAFVLLYSLGRGAMRKATKGAIDFASSLSFSVYILHVFVLNVLYRFGLDPTFINPWAGIPLVSALTWAISAALGIAIRRVPYGRLILP